MALRLLFSQSGMRGIFYTFLFLLLVTPLSAGEPTVQEVQEQALRYASLDQRAHRDWAKQVSWSAALPRLQLGVDRDLKSVAKLSTSDTVSISGGDVTIGPEESQLDQNFDTGTEFQVRAVWDLSELVFHPDSLDIRSELRRENRDRQDLLYQVNQLYFQRQDFLQKLKRRACVSFHCSQEKLKLGETTAHLDALTGGWFSEASKDE